MAQRYKLPPGGDVPPVVAARRLALELDRFKQILTDLMARGFPGPDPVTGNYDLDAIDKWRRGRNKHLYPDENHLTPASACASPDVIKARIAGMRSG